jgi:hypothetical protein
MGMSLMEKIHADAKKVSILILIPINANQAAQHQENMPIPQSIDVFLVNQLVQHVLIISYAQLVLTLPLVFL